MAVEVEACIAGLDLLGKRLNDALAATVADALDLFQLAAIKETPIGKPGNSTNPPGDLARSIMVDGPYEADGVVEGEVGPTLIYGRQRELGGTIYGKPWLHFWSDVPYQILEGGFSPAGTNIYTHAVHQFGAHYMLRAYDEVLLSGSIEHIEEARFTVAIEGG